MSDKPKPTPPTRFVMRRDFMALRPVDDYAAERLRRVKHGEDCLISLTIPRDLKRHAKYWVLLTLVWKNFPEQRRWEIPSIDDFHNRVKMMVGLRTSFTVPPGGMFNPETGEFNDDPVEGYIPGSIRFDKMTQPEFDDFFSRVCDLIAIAFLPGVDSDQLRREVEKITNARIGV